MKAIRADLPEELDNIFIYPLADFHLGDLSSDWFLVKKLLAKIEETPNAYCILGGDLMDTAIASSIGDTYAANLNPMSQIETCCKIFEPIKDKILGIVGGNHERRVYKQDGIDMTQIFANQLGLTDKYSETTFVLFVRFGHDMRKGRRGRKQEYTIYCTHGSGGGRKEGGKINRLVDLQDIIDADVYITAHTHLPASLKTSFFRADRNNSCVKEVTHTFVNTASALRYGGYGEVQGYKPASNDYPVIELIGKKHKAIVHI